MRHSITEFGCITSKLYDALERVAQHADSRRTLKLSRVQRVEVGWCESKIRSVEAVGATLLRMVPLVHPKTTVELALYMDASQDHWGGAVRRQLEPGDVELPLAEHNHPSLAFLSGQFTGSASRWPTIQKHLPL